MNARPGCGQNVMVQFDHRKARCDRGAAVFLGNRRTGEFSAKPHGHLAFDGTLGKTRSTETFAARMAFLREKPSEDRLTHSKLRLDRAPRAADLVTADRLTPPFSQPGD